MNERLRLGVLAVAVAAILVGVASALPARDNDQPGSPSAGKWAKLSSPLVAVLRAEQTSGRGLAVARANGLRVVRGKVRVVVETRGSLSAARRAVRAAGAEVEAAHADLIQALVAPAALAALTRPSAVAYVRAPRIPLPA